MNIKLILDDFRDRFIADDEQNAIADWGYDKNRKAKDRYLQLYAELPKEYGSIFAELHYQLNHLFDFMNRKVRRNRHYNADESRQLISLIDGIGELMRSLADAGVVVDLSDKYKQKLLAVRPFLSESGGSAIPENYHEFMIEKFKPIFSVVYDGMPPVVEDLKRVFNSSHIDKQIDQMIAAIDANPSDAIGKAKDLLESCFKTILDGGGCEYAKGDDMAALYKKVSRLLNLKANSQPIRRLLGNLSGLSIGLIELRNGYGTGHGRSAANFREPSRIEARLAVDVTTALVRLCWGVYERSGLVSETKDGII